MESIEKENDSLKGVLTKNYSRQELDKTRLGELVTLFTNIDVGTTAAQEKDVLGRVYEYFLGKFASAEGKLGGEFYTPSCVVRTLVEMIEPFDGQIYDPCCGSGGMFCQSARFVKEHQGSIRDISIFGQESNPTTWKLAKMNLAIRGLEANLGKHNADSFHDDQHKTLKANYILAIISSIISSGIRSKQGKPFFSSQLYLAKAPPEQAKSAIDTVIKQAELMSSNMTVNSRESTDYATSKSKSKSVKYDFSSHHETLMVAEETAPYGEKK